MIKGLKWQVARSRKAEASEKVETLLIVAGVFILDALLLGVAYLIW